jgi:magnesium transporter
MLRSYGPSCDGSLIEAVAEKIPDTATWVDLEEPTKEEEALVERCIRMDVPTESEMAEIEPSSRLYERDGALYMTVSVLYGVQDGEPRTTPVTFVLTDNRLVTVRYATPKPFLIFADHARRDASLVKDAPTALMRMLDAIVDRLADELESVSRTMDELSHEIFAQSQQERRIPVRKLTALLTRIGQVQTLLNKIRYSSVSTLRMLSFFGASNLAHNEKQSELRHHVGSLSTDVTALSEHASYLIDSLQFMLDATLGLISVEQNAAMKLFSWAAVVFLPPTLIAGIFGMNFRYFPELNFRHGFAVSLTLMIISAVGPYLYFKKRGWI